MAMDPHKEALFISLCEAGLDKERISAIMANVAKQGSSFGASTYGGDDRCGKAPP